MNKDIAKPGEPHRWKKGESGNPAGRPKSKPITAALKAMLDKDDGKAIKAVAAKALQMALKGDFRYYKEMMERIEGKVTESIDVTSNNVNIDATPGLSNAQRDKLAEFEDGPE
jgi:hypothetical protein